jgi:DNA (cytosine-5)-methyltransferase 1
MMPHMSALSLFSGIGGLDLAAEAAGIRTIAMCEKDAFCRSVLRRHWPDVPVYEDITALSGKEVIGHGGSRKKITVIHGGFPCQ